ATARARSGLGPTFIEAQLYRFRAHGGAGDDSKTGYRDVTERQAWEDVCPLKTYFEYLVGLGVINSYDRDRFSQEITAETTAAFVTALASPNPVEADLHGHIYAD